MHVVDPQSLSSLAHDERGMTMLVRQKHAGRRWRRRLGSANERAARRRSNSLRRTDFGQRIANIYSRGTETLVAANLGQIINSSHAQQGDSRALQNSGFNDIKYLIASRGEVFQSGGQSHYSGI